MIRSIRNEGMDSNTKYPYLGIYEGLVVLFISESAGMCVWTANGELNEIGDFDHHWNEALFTRYNGEVILRND